MHACLWIDIMHIHGSYLCHGLCAISVACMVVFVCDQGTRACDALKISE